MSSESSGHGNYRNSKKILASDPNVQHFKPPGFVCQACRVHSCQACSPSIVLSANQPQNRPVFLRNRIHMGWSKSPDSVDQAFSQGVLRADASTKGRETHQSRPLKQSEISWTSSCRSINFTANYIKGVVSDYYQNSWNPIIQSDLGNGRRCSKELSQLSFRNNHAIAETKAVSCFQRMRPPSQTMGRAMGQELVGADLVTYPPATGPTKNIIFICVYIYPQKKILPSCSSFRRSNAPAHSNLGISRSCRAWIIGCCPNASVKALTKPT